METPDSADEEEIPMAGATAERTLIVRPLEEAPDYVAAERLQQRVWGQGDLGRSSLVDMLNAQDSGGIVIGAFDGEELVGFVFSLLGMTPWGQLKQASVLMGVLPEHRGRGIGVRLKLAQREAALAAGIDLITWTFDPLVAVNAELNLTKLGGTSHEYLVNYYGDSAAGLNAGLPTDRLLLQWSLADEPSLPTVSTAAYGKPTSLIAFRWCAGTDIPAVTGITEGADEPRVFLPIPRSIGALKDRDAERALEWRLATRALFLELFGRGYVAVDFRADRRGDGLPGYVLERPQW
jgi:predicted GNAT superfamily acetyltransferase